jgi:hypothetical protein
MNPERLPLKHHQRAQQGPRRIESVWPPPPVVAPAASCIFTLGTGRYTHGCPGVVHYGVLLTQRWLDNEYQGPEEPLNEFLEGQDPNRVGPGMFHDD